MRDLRTNPMTPIIKEIEVILASNLQLCEKVERIAGALRRSGEGPEVAAWLLVMKGVRG